MGAHGEHEHGEHGPEPFPRHATVDAVADELAARGRSERLQRLLVALGLVLLALALPTRGLFGQCVPLVEATSRGAWAGAHLLPCAAARGLVQGAGLDAERAWFLLSACALGLAFLALARITRMRGWEHGPAVVIALLALAAPVALVAGTTPDASVFRLLGTALFASELVRGASGPRRRALAWLLAAALHAGNAWAWPALLVVELRSRTALSVLVRIAPALVAACSFVLVSTVAQGDPSGSLHAAARALLAGGSGAARSALAWWTLWLPALGAAGVGLAAWITDAARGGWRREPELVLLALVPWVAQSLGGAIDFELPFLELVPIGLLGLLGLFQWSDERGHGGRARAAAIGLGLCGLLGAAWIRGLDRHAEWTRVASETLNPGDVVLTASRAHRHLLEHRFRVTTVDLASAGGRPQAERQRFLDEQTAAAARLAAEGRRLVVDADSLFEGGTLVWPDRAQLDAFVAHARPVVLPDAEMGDPFEIASPAGR